LLVKLALNNPFNNSKPVCLRAEAAVPKSLSGGASSKILCCTLVISPIGVLIFTSPSLRGRLNTKNLTIADYTTGSIVSVALDGTAVVGTGTSWTQEMVGSYIQIAVTQADNGGDGFWYEIATVTDTTHLTLVKPYEGVSIVAGTASYTIGQCSVIPEAYDVGIVYRATALYWDNNNDIARAKGYWLKYDGGNEAGLNKDYGGLIGQMIVTEGETEEGAYIPPFGSTDTFPNQGPYYFPYQDGSGF